MNDINEDKKAIESKTPDDQTGYPINARTSEAVVIHCADPRFQIPFRRFIIEDLGIRSYSPLVIGGGAHSLGAKSKLPESFRIVWEQMEFFINVSGLHRVILINHEDCLWYKKMESDLAAEQLKDKGRKDLRISAETIAAKFPEVRIETFWAALNDGQVSFEKV